MDWISHCVKEGRWKVGDRTAASMLLVLLALSLLGWVYLTQASRMATTSRRVQDLEEEKTRLQEENLQLMAEIAGLESVSRLCARAQELGFTQALVEDTHFLVVSDLPSVEQVASRTSPPTVGWWDNVASQFTTWVQVKSP
jgi:hypothetical protein